MNTRFRTPIQHRLRGKSPTLHPRQRRIWRGEGCRQVEAEETAAAAIAEDTKFIPKQ